MMAELYSQTYETPWGYGEEKAPVAPPFVSAMRIPVSLVAKPYPISLVVKSYPIPPFVATIPLLSGCSGWIGKTKTITWDPLKTTVTSSRLIIKAHAKNDPIDFNVKFNGLDVRSFFWGEGTRCTEQSDIIDVQIVNGTNLLEVDACKHIPWIGVASVDVDAYIEVNFEGEVPEEDWWEIFWQWIETNWPYIAIGTGLVIIAGSAYVYLARPKS